MTQAARLSLAADRRAAALVEFALAAPMLVLILLGMVVYGQYFLLAHSTQQVANDAARASIAGLTAEERRAIALASAAEEVATLGLVPADAATASVRESDGVLTISVTVDARAAGLLRVPIVPTPDPSITRRAVIRIGGLP